MSFALIRRRMPRPVYVVLRLGEALISSLSRFINATFFGGSTHQTTSARAYLDGMTDAKWARRRAFIDAIFFLQADHCRKAWEYEIENARKTLARAGVSEK